MDITTVILNIVLLMMLWYLVFFAFRELRLDITRQRLFKIRDDIFKYAEEGNLSFDSKAYCMIRTILNGMIRFAHKASVIRMGTTIFVDQYLSDGKEAAKYEEELKDAFHDLPLDVKKELTKARIDMHITIVKHMTFSSVFLSILFFIATILHITQLVGKKLLFGSARKKWSSFDAEIKSNFDAEVKAFGENRACT